MEICACHYKYDIEWLKKSPWPVTIVHKEGGDEYDREYFSNTWSTPNVGLEVTAYLDFIIKRWDTLPDRVAFLHGHEESYHQKAGRPLLELIRDANPNYPYVSLNNSWRCVNTNAQLAPIKEAVAKFGFPELPMRFITDSSAQFIVTRQAIQRFPLELYKELHKVPVDRADATVAELCIWVPLFTGDFNFVPKPNHFYPPIPEIFYSTACGVPMRFSDFRFAYVGTFVLNGSPIIYIKTKEEFEYHAIRGTTMFLFEGDQPPFECDDPGRIVVITEESRQAIFDLLINEALEFDKVYQHYINK